MTAARATSRCKSGSSEMAVTLETPLARVLGPKTATHMAEQLSLPREAVLAFSATDKLGLDEVWDALLNTVK